MKLAMTTVGGSTTVEIEGAMDATAEAVLRPLLTEVKDSKVQIKLGRVSSINSIGASQWIQFIRPFSKDHAVEFLECPEMFTSYCSLIAVMPGTGKIVSFIVSFHCTKCGRSAPLVLENKNAEAQFGDRPCPDCAGSMEPELPAVDYLGSWAR